MIDWFGIGLTEEHATLTVTSPGRPSWTAKIRWKDIERVCYEPGDWLQSDTLYVFVAGRPESYVIPTEADGGLAFWQALIEQGLFDAALAVEVAGATEGVFCWPPA